MRRRRPAQITILLVLIIITGGGWYAWDQRHTPRARVFSVLEEFDERPFGPPVEKLAGLPGGPYPYLIEAMEMTDGSLRKQYISLYGHFPQALQSRINRPLPDTERARNAAEFFTAFCAQENDFSDLFSVLRQTNREAHRLIWRAMLERLEAPKPWPYDSLAQQATNTLPDVRDFVLEAFQAFGNKGRSAEAHFVPLLNQPDEMVVLGAAKTIWLIDGDMTRVVPALDRLLDSKSPTVQTLAAYQLLFISREHPRLPATFMQVAKVTDYSLRAVALNHLPYCGQRAVPLLPEIKTYLGDEDYGVRFAATNAVQQIEGRINAENVAPLGKMYRFAFEKSVINRLKIEWR